MAGCTSYFVDRTRRPLFLSALMAPVVLLIASLAIGLAWPPPVVVPETMLDLLNGLLVLTTVVLALFLRKTGVHRPQGVIILSIYAFYVIVKLAQF